MKTRLLFLMFVLSIATFAQINIDESFESGLPTNWTTTGQSRAFTRSNSTYSCDGSFSMFNVFNTSNNNASIVTSNYVSDANPLSLSFLYNRDIGSLTGTISIDYELNNSGNWVRVGQSSNFSPGCNTFQTYIQNNVLPTGANVKFRIQIVRTGGVQLGVFIDKIQIKQETFTAQYSFDNTYNDTTGINPFTDTNTVFVDDRNGNMRSALQLNPSATPRFASIWTIPKGNDSRTVSMWFKSNLTSNIGIFSYGTNATEATFGVYLGLIGSYVFQSFVTDADFGGNYAANTWSHLVVTYDGSMVKIYVNGSLVNTSQYTLNTGNDPNFKIGNNNSILSIDDLKLYGRAITGAEIQNLYTNNSLSAKDYSTKNLKVALYPNPVRNILNIETATEIKSIAIYNLLGQKVKTAKSRNINVADLSNGTYMVRVEDTNNAVKTMKIVKQ